MHGHNPCKISYNCIKFSSEYIFSLNLELYFLLIFFFFFKVFWSNLGILQENSQTFGYEEYESNFSSTFIVSSTKNTFPCEMCEKFLMICTFCKKFKLLMFSILKRHNTLLQFKPSERKITYFKYFKHFFSCHKTSWKFNYVCGSMSFVPPWILKQGGLESSGWRLISFNSKTEIIAKKNWRKEVIFFLFFSWFFRF